ncbi:MAG TPA: hypothetical protein VNN10_15695 [Dehalococcoidia bacterium]|nr:hypothetical protein [Dehalococcoidia bacterium]
MSKFKFGFGALALFALMALGAFGMSANDASANIIDVEVAPFELSSGGFAGSESWTDGGDCDDMPGRGTVPVSPVGAFIVPLGGQIAICVQLDGEQGNDGTDSADVTFDANEVGRFREAICANNDGDGDWFEFDDDDCLSTEGIGTDQLTVDCAEQPGTPPCSDDSPDQGGIVVIYQCPSTLDAPQTSLLLSTGITTTIHITASDADGGLPDSEVDVLVSCRPTAGGATLTASPTTVEIVPAPSNTAHSLIQLTVTDAAGNPILIAPSTDVDFSTDRCAIEETNVDTASELGSARTLIAALTTSNPASYVAWDTFANSVAPDSSPLADNSSVFDFDISGINVSWRSMAAAILHCDPHAGITTATPGVATVTACLEVPDAADICRTVTVTVIGPPASITVAASPTSLRCGEKSTITVTVKDAIGQNVSDHTLVEMVTNLGGTIGGTGGVLSFVGPVVPVSSNGAGTFGGVATAFLLTSESHSGPYEVVATTGGTLPGGGAIGIFSTPPISAQVTVTCTIPAPTAAPAPTVTAPRTGTGITPPSTGDAGLSSSSSSWTLFAIGGLAAFALAGLATLRFARR